MRLFFSVFLSGFVGFQWWVFIIGRAILSELKQLDAPQKCVINVDERKIPQFFQKQTYTTVASGLDIKFYQKWMVFTRFFLNLSLVSASGSIKPVVRHWDAIFPHTAFTTVCLDPLWPMFLHSVSLVWYKASKNDKEKCKLRRKVSMWANIRVVKTKCSWFIVWYFSFSALPS